MKDPNPDLALARSVLQTEAAAILALVDRLDALEPLMRKLVRLHAIARETVIATAASGAAR